MARARPIFLSSSIAMSNGMLTRSNLPSCDRCASTSYLCLRLCPPPLPSSLVLASPPNLRTICGAPTFSILAHALTNHSALISTLIFSVTPAASPSTRRHSTAPISRPGGTKEPPRQSLGHCQPHRAYARYARSKLHTRGTYPSMREAAHTVSGSRF